jgi:hypothetical protein
MSVEILKNNNDWNTFLQTNRTGSVYHSLKWRNVIQKTFGLKPLYLLIKDDLGRVVGVFPSFIKSFMGLKICDSLYFSDYGGPIIDKEYFKFGMLLLKSYLRNYCSDNGVDCVRFNFLAETGFYLNIKQSSSNVDKTSGVMEIDLSLYSSDSLWNDVFTSGTRRKLRNAAKACYQIRVASSKADLFEFYDQYSQGLSKIGFSGDTLELVENIWDAFYPHELRLLQLIDGNKFLGGLLMLLNDWGSYARYSSVDKCAIGNRFAGSDYLRWLEVLNAEKEHKSVFSLGATSSDPSHSSFVQKIRNGACFHLQEKMLYPVSTKGYGLVFVKSKAVPIWVGTQKILPYHMNCFLQRRLSRLNSL